LVGLAGHRLDTQEFALSLELLVADAITHAVLAAAAAAAATTTSLWMSLEWALRCCDNSSRLSEGSLYTWLVCQLVAADAHTVDWPKVSGDGRANICMMRVVTPGIDQGLLYLQDLGSRRT
jgi:hypothetical protein